jgi:hypothetical protein
MTLEALLQDIHEPSSHSRVDLGTLRHLQTTVISNLGVLQVYVRMGEQFLSWLIMVV